MIFLHVFSYFGCLLLAAGIDSQIPDPDMDEIDPQIDDAAADADLMSFFDPNKVTSIKRKEEQLRALCLQHGGEEALAKASAALENIGRCFDEIKVYAALPAKMEEMKPKGNLDVVFKEYCEHTSEMKRCMYTFLAEIDPCLSDRQRTHKRAVESAAETILDFVCEDDGDHVALFVSEKGFECIEQKEEAIESCVKRYVNGSTPNDNADDGPLAPNEEYLNGVPDSANFLSPEFAPEQCETVFKIRDCIIAELMTCASRTPVNVVESVFKLTLCNTTCARNEDCNSGGVSVYYSLSSFVIPMFIWFFNFRN